MSEIKTKIRTYNDVIDLFGEGKHRHLRGYGDLS